MKENGGRICQDCKTLAYYCGPITEGGNTGIMQFELKNCAKGDSDVGLYHSHPNHSPLSGKAPGAKGGDVPNSKEHGIPVAAGRRGVRKGDKAEENSGDITSDLFFRDSNKDYYSTPDGEIKEMLDPNWPHKERP